MKAYIFDLDGTLLDSMGVWEQIDIEFLKKREIEVTPNYMNAVCALSFQETAAYTIERFGLTDRVDELLKEWNAMAAYAYGHTIRRYFCILRKNLGLLLKNVWCSRIFCRRFKVLSWQE